MYWYFQAAVSGANFALFQSSNLISFYEVILFYFLGFSNAPISGQDRGQTRVNESCSESNQEQTRVNRINERNVTLTLLTFLIILSFLFTLALTLPGQNRTVGRNRQEGIATKMNRRKSYQNVNSEQVDADQSKREKS